MLFAEETEHFFRCENRKLKLFTDTPSMKKKLLLLLLLLLLFCLPFKKKNLLYDYELIACINKMNVLIQWVFL